jgi:hypothetical protein
MEMIFDAIQNALNAPLPFAAVVMALAVPDICGALKDPNGRATAAAYKVW